MSDLIARLIATTEGTDDLDRDIAKLISSDPVRAALAFTSSFEAALTLIPPQANSHGYDLTPRGVEAYVSRNNVQSGHWLHSGWHKSSAPIAMCIAALKAREEA